MKKVLFVASTAGHINNFHIPYIEEFKALGWEADVACGGFENLDAANNTIHLPFVKKMFSLSNLKATIMLRKHIKSNGYDLVLCHTSLAAFFARLAVLLLKKRPAVCNMVHGYLFDERSPFIKRLVLTLAEKIVAPVTDLAICMNEYDRAYAEKKALAKRVEFVNGIGLDSSKYPEFCLSERRTLRKDLGFKESDFLLLYAAEFSKRKSQVVLIEALASLPCNTALLLPGNGELLEQCRKRAAELGLGNRVRFPGYVNNMGLWYMTADAAVSSSRSEGLPFNVLEAMHYELPVVASNVKGHTDLVSSGVNGLLYEYGDSGECAERILSLLENRAYASALGEAAKKKAEDYNLEEVKQAIMGLYLSCVD